MECAAQYFIKYRLVRRSICNRDKSQASSEELSENVLWNMKSDWKLNNSMHILQAIISRVQKQTTPDFKMGNISQQSKEKLT